MNAKADLLWNPKTLSKPLLLLLGVLLGGTLLWAGDKPWKAKPYGQWNEKELQAILTDSPWVKVTPIQRSWVPSTERNSAPLERNSPGAKGQTAAGLPKTAADGDGDDMQELNVQVYWQSSRVMRAATARQAVLHGEKVDVDKYASQPQDEYQIVVRMQDMTPFQEHDEKFFQANASLQMKKGKDKVSPTHVVYEKNSMGLVQDVVFLFSKTTSSGAPLVSDEETEVQFSCKIADTTVRVGFKPRDMMDQSGPAL